MWYAVFYSDTGVLYSVGEVLGNPLHEGLEAIEVGKERPEGVWNTEKRIFEPAPVVKPTLSLKELQDRFTKEEREALFGVQSSALLEKLQLGAFQKYIEYAGGADLNDPYIIESVQLMETAGVIAQGRAAEILA